jgi:hypothetical protein
MTWAGVARAYVRHWTFAKRGSCQSGHSRPDRGGQTPASAGRRSTSY